MIIGITGGTGCGKTTALNVIRELGGTVLDCDAIYHRMLETDPDLIAAIARRFPDAFSGGILQRKRLGQIVFSDSEALAELTAITQKAVCQEVRRRLIPPPPLAAIDAISLLESGLGELCQITVAITAPFEDRITRLMARDGISEAYAAARIHAQKPQSYFRENCDYVLENTGTPEQFREKCLAFFQTWAIMKENPHK